MEKKNNLMWSVELESNAWKDDSFIGTVEECIEYCEVRGVEIDGEKARLALVDINTGYCYNIVNNLDELVYPKETIYINLS